MVQPITFSHRPYGRINQIKNACTSYQIKMACGKKTSLDNIVIKHTDGLSLKPGNVAEDHILAGFCPNTEIMIPPCVSILSEQCTSIEVKKNDQAALDGQDGCILTSTVMESDRASVCIGDILSYTVTFTNQSSCLLERVRILNHLPECVTVIPGSIHPAPGEGESLQNGISVGCVAAGDSVSLHYSVSVDCCALNMLINQARAVFSLRGSHGCYESGIGSTRCCVVKVFPTPAHISMIQRAHKACLYSMCCRKCPDTNCLLRPIEKEFHIFDLKCIQHCFVYHTGTKYYNTVVGGAVKVGYGIAIKYMDCNQKIKCACFETKEAFFQLPACFDCCNFISRLSNLSYSCDCSRNIKVCFIAQLCNCRMDCNR